MQDTMPTGATYKYKHGSFNNEEFTVVSKFEEEHVADAEDAFSELLQDKHNA